MDQEPTLELTEDEICQVLQAQRAEIESKVRVAEIVDALDRLIDQRNEAITIVRKAVAAKNLLYMELSRSRGLTIPHVPDIAEGCLVPAEDHFDGDTDEIRMEDAKEKLDVEKERKSGGAVSVRLLEDEEM